ncbi:MAG: hypothetical protein J0H31_17790 [Alphaproteobacteria bacterium]|nr:hypothetical protein [Alphaproteobacteria bacterium]
MLRAIIWIAVAACSVAQAMARDIFPDNLGEQPLVFAVGSKSVLLPLQPWSQVMWRFHWDNGVTEPAIAYFSFDIRVVKDSSAPRGRAHMEVTFDGQSSWSHSAPCRAKPEVQATLYSKKGDRIQPTFRFAGDIYKHDVGKHFAFSSPPIESYNFDEIGKIALSAGVVAADCGD